MFEYRTVLVRMRQGDSDRTIARARLMGRRKAAQLRALAEEEGWLDKARPLPEDAVLAARLASEPAKGSAVACSSVEPFRTQVLAWHAAGIQGTTIHKALQRNHGYAGSYSAVRRFLQGLEQTPAATVILDFAPGDAAQVDFGAGPPIGDEYGELRKSWVFVMTLCYSRHQYAELIWHQDVETWLECHRRAFAWFGAVPRRIIIDNAKCAITRACYRDPQVQRAYAECAEGYGFKIDPCPPRDPRKKGRVEAGVKYVKRSFLPLREFRSLPDANAQLQRWVLEEAGNRLHGSTRRRPLELFEQTDKPHLLALPDVLPQLAAWAKVKVHRDAHVQFQRALYSVPFRLIGQVLWLKAAAGTVQLFCDQELVATHPRLRRAGQRSTVDDHMPPEALAYKLRDPQWCLQAAERIGPHCRTLVERLFADRVLENLRAVQGVLRLKDKYGAARLEAACLRALAFDNPRYRAVKTILDKGLDQHPSDQQAFDDLADAYTGHGRFSRDTRKLLTH